MKTYRKLLLSVCSLVIVSAILFAPLGIFGGGPTVVYASDGLAQLSIEASQPIKSIIVIGENQDGNQVTWTWKAATDDGESPPILTKTGNTTWWWRFKSFCPWWWRNCDESRYPPSSQIAPRVWVEYTNGAVVYKRCVKENITSSENQVPCYVPDPPSSSAEVIFPKGIQSYKGVQLYKDGSDFIQVAHLDQGATVSFLYGQTSPSGSTGYYKGLNPIF